MGCRQCDMITTPKRRPIVFDRKESYGRYTSQSYLNHRLPHCRVLLSAGKAPDHPRAILHQTRRPDCGTAEGILYSHSPAIKTEKRQQTYKSVAYFFLSLFLPYTCFQSSLKGCSYFIVWQICFFILPIISQITKMN